MPGIDKTGPLGTGPIGRGMGPCGGGFAGRGRGRGFGRGFGMGWNAFPRGITTDEEKVVLERQKDWLEAQVAEISKRLQEMEKTNKSE